MNASVGFTLESGFTYYLGFKVENFIDTPCPEHIWFLLSGPVSALSLPCLCPLSGPAMPSFPGSTLQDCRADHSSSAQAASGEWGKYGQFLGGMPGLQTHLRGRPTFTPGQRQDFSGCYLLHAAPFLLSKGQIRRP